MSREVESAPLFTTAEYFGLVESGAVGPDDRVELLEGVIVAVSPQSPRHGVDIAKRGDRIELAAFPGTFAPVDAMLPTQREPSA